MASASRQGDGGICSGVRKRVRTAESVFPGRTSPRCSCFCAGGAYLRTARGRQGPGSGLPPGLYPTDPGVEGSGVEGHKVLLDMLAEAEVRARVFHLPASGPVEYSGRTVPFCSG